MSTKDPEEPPNFEAEASDTEGRHFVTALARGLEVLRCFESAEERQALRIRKKDGLVLDEPGRGGQAARVDRRSAAFETERALCVRSRQHVLCMLDLL